MQSIWPKVSCHSLRILSPGHNLIHCVTYISHNLKYTKALLKTGKLNCDDLTDEESEQADDCALEIILREIVNNQNAQIQAMRALLEAKNYPEENDCKVPIGEMSTGDESSNGSALFTSDESPKKPMTTSLPGENSSNHITNSGVVFGMLLLFALSLSFV